MSTPFLSEIRLFSFQDVPRGWSRCDGALLPINQNQALFALLGTAYGGNGQTTFALPDLRGRAPLHVADGTRVGERGGSESHILTLQELAPHSHEANATSALAVDSSPGDRLPATTQEALYAPPGGPMVGLDTRDVEPSGGGGTAHNNMQPYLALSYCICRIGLFPSPNPPAVEPEDVTPFLGEIRMFGFNFVPPGWFPCDGRLLPISENDALFTLIGTTYGGDGEESFALPDLQGRVPIGFGQLAGGSLYPLAQKAGTETETLALDDIPPHVHAVGATTLPATSNSPTGTVLAHAAESIYQDATHPTIALQTVPMHSSSIGAGGGGQPHDNMMPFCAITFAIAAYGVFPQFS